MDAGTDADRDAGPVDASSDATGTTDGSSADATVIDGGETRPLAFLFGAEFTPPATRTSLDDACVAGRSTSYPDLPSNVIAFISVSDTDEIRDLPSNDGAPTDRPIAGPTGTIIANDWADLFDGSIKVSLTFAGVTSGAGWTSGSTGTGAVATNCLEWTSTTHIASQGSPTSIRTAWLNNGVVFTCGRSLRLLCLAY